MTKSQQMIVMNMFSSSDTSITPTLLCSYHVSYTFVVKFMSSVSHNSNLGSLKLISLPKHLQNILYTISIHFWWTNERFAYMQKSLSPY